ncbi:MULTISPECIES: hypothetical protein [Haloferax]|uniref:Uncharacterized protein n=1 Tax=Haloferax massiliensis TaxID=1476858 RepID=A0A0D6JRF1_9EURY|nr:MULTISPECIES: hypothetical protein [Haloferax]WEL25542.1 hypothetical protein SVXHx_1231 [Haloferax lucentense]CQR50238.1 hypothetical protein BN996_01715 [Haloferax massiliensis]
MSDSPKQESDDLDDGDGDLWYDAEVDESELGKKRLDGLSPVPTEHGRKVAFNALPLEASRGPGRYDNYWTDPDPPYEPKSHVIDGSYREPPAKEDSWRLIRYNCGSCKKRCLVDHAERAVKLRQCRDCARVPALDDKLRDHRLTSLLWAHMAARDSTARSGEDGQVLGGSAAHTRDRPDRPAGSEGSPLDPEAGPHESGGRRAQTRGGAVQSDELLAADGGERE